MNNRNRQDGESYISYVKRLTENKHEYDLDYSEWAKLICDYDCSSENGRKAYYVVSKLVDKLDDEYTNMVIDSQPQQMQDELLVEIEQKQQELKKERYKLNDERNRLNALLRTEARWEVIVDYLKKTIESYTYEPTDYITYKRYEGGQTEASLLLSDWHIGSTFNTFHNIYNLDIAKSRANRLRDDVIDYCVLHKVKTLYIEILGDITSGIIHLGTRLSNNENVIQQVIESSEMLSKFIYEISLVVPNIKLVYCVGNHGRVNANVKESIVEENFEYLIRWHLETKLAQLQNVSWVYNVIDKEVAHYELDCGRSIASCHGHREKNYKEAVKNLTHYFGVCKVDEVHMGHFHNHQVINNVVVNGSFMGVDPYASELRYNDIPSQTLRVYDIKGNFITYQINLN